MADLPFIRPPKPGALYVDIIAEGGSVGPIEVRQVPGRGRGIYMDTDAPPSAPLMTIPPACLINVQTIASKYPKEVVYHYDEEGNPAGLLNSIQSLSMHLYLNRTSKTDNYITSLPSNFQEHPLAWRLLKEAPVLTDILRHAISPSVKRALDKVDERFSKDARAVLDAMLGIGMIADESEFDPTGFLWGWLCVNTRCIHYSLDGKDHSRSIKDVDLTLAPVIDLANHTADPNLACEVRRGKDGALRLFTPKKGLKKGQEVLFHYNSHPNSVLFSEYGFVVSRRNGALHGQELQVDDIMEEMFAGEKNEWKREMLEEADFWGNWSIYLSGRNPEVSFRLIPPLRLLHIAAAGGDEDEDDDNPEATEELEAWEGTINGTHEDVSLVNELHVRKSLRRIGTEVIKRVDHYLGILNKVWTDYGIEKPFWIVESKKYIEVLWREEREVAVALINSLDKGDELW